MNNDLQYSIRAFVAATVCCLLIFLFISKSNKKSENSFEKITQQPVSKVTVIPNEHGEKLFKDNCNVCHAIGRSDFLLQHVEERVPNKKILYAFIRNSQQVIESGDPYFTALYESFNSVSMPAFPTLSDNDISDMLEYINQYYESNAMSQHVPA